ncbi:3119_t:CDS:2, partial [Cetraspora pellucida]
KTTPSNNNEFEGQLENEIEKISFANIIEYISNKIANLEFTTGSTNSVHHSGVSKFYLACSQYHELECKYKESNHKRMVHFDCYRKLIISIDIAMKEAKIKLSHDFQHERPVDVTTPEEIKHEIIQNFYINSVQLRTHICQRFDATQITSKQINYWWFIFNQCFFKLDEDPFISTHCFLDDPNNSSKFCYKWNDNLTEPSNLIKISIEDEVLNSVSDNNLVEFDKNNEAFNPEIHQICEEKVLAVRCMANHLEQELAVNNFNYITHVVNNMDRLFAMLNDIETAQNQRIYNLTWRGSTP